MKTVRAVQHLQAKADEEHLGRLNVGLEAEQVHTVPVGLAPGSTDRHGISWLILLSGRRTSLT
ncbi:hypothetical protein [Streptomyces sp. NPDC059874]|uniref:hypothetical protein n=1 Tax=Streptomyces sp. NPDC059874 TaxID=3346983 RepID=UPI003664AB42